ncbi:MAG: hypothetical protein HYT70_03100 [Candidatus Aenigmarchaeota archaeon]|nr:hypothetical protein [Candidatus Aenigmarchaeota archaeon]
MRLLKTMPIILAIFLAGCAAQVDTGQETMQPAEGLQEAQAPPETPLETQPVGEGTLQGEVVQQEETPAPPAIREFTIEADDSGFYIDNKDISSISVSSGDFVSITYQVRSQGVYYGGLDFRGCGQSTPSVKPGDSIKVQFTALSTCAITSYWPVSNVAKDSMQVIVP